MYDMSILSAIYLTILFFTLLLLLESFYTRGFRRITKGPDRDSYFHEVSVVQYEIHVCQPYYN